MHGTGWAAQKSKRKKGLSACFTDLAVQQFAPGARSKMVGFHMLVTPQYQNPPPPELLAEA
jgi:hypothetical protein